VDAMSPMDGQALIDRARVLRGAARACFNWSRSLHPVDDAGRTRAGVVRSDGFVLVGVYLVCSAASPATRVLRLLHPAHEWPTHADVPEAVATAMGRV
jgi:hypothetical protein